MGYLRSATSGHFVKEGFGGSQIIGSEPFRESAVSLGKDHAALGAPDPSQSNGCAQFEGSGALASSDLECLSEAPRSRFRGI